VVVYSVVVCSAVVCSVVVCSEVVCSVVVCSEVVYCAVTGKEIFLVLERSDGCFFLLLEYNFCLRNWIRVDFTPQIQINKQIVNTICGSDEPHPYPVRSFTYLNEQVRPNEVQN
jgi:hypothetical protein